jgi:hypothetical protein
MIILKSYFYFKGKRICFSNTIMLRVLFVASAKYEIVKEVWLISAEFVLNFIIFAMHV